MVILLALAAAAAQPSAEALRLGNELARHGTLAALLPLMKSQQTDELIKDHPELSAAEQAKLRGTADRVFETGRDRVLAATGKAYAQALSVKDLKAALAFYRSSAGARFQASLPQVIVGTMTNVGKLDFKADVVATFCKDTGKLCDK